MCKDKESHVSDFPALGAGKEVPAHVLAPRLNLSKLPSTVVILEQDSPRTANGYCNFPSLLSPVRRCTLA